MPLQRVITITTGTVLYNTGSDTTELYVECFGGGGGGGGASGAGRSGGGGAGGYSAQAFATADISASFDGAYTVSIGDGGAGGLGELLTRDTNTGSAGGNTFFGTFPATASLPFVDAKGGDGGQGSSSPKGGAGGNAAAGTGSLVVDGASGSVGFNYQDTRTKRQHQSGAGADGFFGGGGLGISSEMLNQPLGNTGSLFGAGGGGSLAGRGAPGSHGFIRIWEFS